MPEVVHATIAELLLARADEDNTALKFEDSTWSWRELVREAAERASLLHELHPDNKPWHVGLLMENTPEYLFWITGAALAGATIVGINPTKRGAELARDIRTTDCATVLVEPAYMGLLSGLSHDASRVIDVCSVEYGARLSEHRGAALAPTQDAFDPRTRLLLLFTSGSTAAPKAVSCSTGRWATTCQLEPISFGPDDVAYNAMPLFHGNALMGAFGPCLANGAAFAMRRRFSASGFLPDIRKFPATFFNYVGRSLAYVLAQPEQPAEADNRLRFGFGTEASTQDRTEFARRFGCELFESYGSSEGACYIVRTPDTPDGALGVGQKGHFPEILDVDGRVCPPARFSPEGSLLNPEEAIGEIVSRGAAEKFEGYYNNPEATREKLRDGDFWTGDLGYRDEHGFFWFAGRDADTLRVDSENFAAAPIERLLARFPGVEVSAVYPVPDARTGDRVMATLQTNSERFDPAVFAEFLDNQPDLGTKWAPTYVRVTPELPLTAISKVDKSRLRHMLWSGDDLVYERTDSGYLPLTADAMRRLHEQFHRHGRAELIGR